MPRQHLQARANLQNCDDFFLLDCLHQSPHRTGLTFCLGRCNRPFDKPTVRLLEAATHDAQLVTPQCQVTLKDLDVSVKHANEAMGVGQPILLTKRMQAHAIKHAQKCEVATTKVAATILSATSSFSISSKFVRNSQNSWEQLGAPDTNMLAVQPHMHQGGHASPSPATSSRLIAITRKKTQRMLCANVVGALARPPEQSWSHRKLRSIPLFYGLHLKLRAGFAGRCADRLSCIRLASQCGP
jgi:hypothetical protein